MFDYLGQRPLVPRSRVIDVIRGVAGRGDVAGIRNAERERLGCGLGALSASVSSPDVGTTRGHGAL